MTEFLYHMTHVRPVSVWFMAVLLAHQSNERKWHLVVSTDL